MTPDVQSTNERFVYRVASDTSGKVYRVDLLANNGGGKCACADHGIRRQPFIDAGGDPFSREGFCKHINKARIHFLRSLLADLAKADDRP